MSVCECVCVCVYVSVYVSMCECVCVSVYVSMCECVCVLSLFGDSTFLCSCSWPETFPVDQTKLKIVPVLHLCLPSAWIAGMCYPVNVYYRSLTLSISQSSCLNMVTCTAK